MDLKVINELYDWMMERFDEHVCIEIFDYLLEEKDGFVRDNLNSFDDVSDEELNYLINRN